MGYKATLSPNDTHQILYSLNSACTICDPGSYGNDPKRLECYPGTPGYAFLGGTTSPYPVNITTQHGFMCQTGYWCPESTSVPNICPAATYQPTIGNFITNFTHVVFSLIYRCY